jgi:succinate dehydrogenase / fumarate reductase cytochrome b subunit
MQAKALRLHDTTIGKKALLALTGAVLYGFVVVHMLGNLQVFLGREAYNAYAAGLKAMPGVVWAARGVLLGSFAVHVALSMSLVARSAGARDVGYRTPLHRKTTYAALTMKYGGPALGLFVLFHIAHFTFPGVSLGSYDHSTTDVYGNFVGSFQNPIAVLLYAVANLFLGLHLYHGGWSLLQTLGLSHPRYDRLLRLGLSGLGVLVATGNVLMPVAVLTGAIP